MSQQYQKQKQKWKQQGRAEMRKEVEKLIDEWWNDEKTCSGKPHCCIEECDLCINCFEELKQKLQEKK